MKLRFHNTIPAAGDEATHQWMQKQKDGESVNFELTDVDPGSKLMLNTWMKWMTEVAAHMTSKGITVGDYITPEGKIVGSNPFEQKHAHDFYTKKFLGKDKKGNRKSWKLRGHTEEERQANKGERLYAMNQLVQLATEHGIFITIPVDGEYRDLMREQGE